MLTLFCEDGFLRPLHFSPAHPNKREAITEKIKPFMSSEMAKMFMEDSFMWADQRIMSLMLPSFKEKVMLNLVRVDKHDLIRNDLFYNYLCRLIIFKTQNNKYFLFKYSFLPYLKKPTLGDDDSDDENSFLRLTNLI